MSNRLHRKSVRRPLTKAISSAVIMLGIATTSSATELSGEPAGSNSQNGAEFAFTIDDETCAVTINSNMKIRRYAFKNADGRTIKAGGVRRKFRSASVTGFVDLFTAHPEGSLRIRTQDGKWSKINADVNLAFTQCLNGDEETETEEETGGGEETGTVFTNLEADTTCSFANEYVTAVVEIRENPLYEQFYNTSDTATSCFFNTVPNSTNGNAGIGALSVVEFQGGLFGVTRTDQSGQIVEELTNAADAGACAVFLGCENFPTN